MRTVADAMTAPPAIVAPTTTIQDASRAMLALQAHAAVVVDDGQVCGLTSADDIAHALANGHDAGETLVGVIAQKEPPVVRVDDTLVDAHQRLQTGGLWVAVVVDSDGAPVGLLDAAP